MRALATTLLGGDVVGDQIDEARVHPLERGSLRVGDVSRNVFECEGLRPHARDRGRKCTEDTHDFFSNCERQAPGPTPLRLTIAISVPMKTINCFRRLDWTAANRHPARLAVTGNSCRAARANPDRRKSAIRLARAAIAAERRQGARAISVYSTANLANGPRMGSQNRLLLCCFRRLD
jgi:hypothetical protein